MTLRIQNLDNKIEELEAKALQIRKHVVDMVYEAGSGHPGGSLSSTDILTVLYFHVMKHKPENRFWEDRDRFVLSKGHAAPALYATLAEAGYFPIEELLTLRKLGSKLQGHPDMRRVPGVEMSTGSLGQGLSVGVGMALAGKLDKKEYKVFVIVGDGESNSGQIWEAGMAAAHFKLDNLFAFLDRNKLQIDGPTEEIMKLEPLAEKWDAFGWHVIEIDGHNMKEIIKAIQEGEKITNKPKMIIANTTKGKGVSFMEDCLNFHGKAPNCDEYDIACNELKQCNLED